MKYDPTIHHRRSIRLKGYDYTQPGAYFVTLVTFQRECLLGKIENGVVHLSVVGKMVADQWNCIPKHQPVTSLGEWIIMPNHLHGIIVLGKGEASARMMLSHNKPDQADASPQRPIGTASGSLGAILQNFKSITTRKINQTNSSPGAPLWQRNYYEHIIRDDGEWQRISDYIRTNPLCWQDDPEYGRSADEL